MPSTRHAILLLAIFGLVALPSASAIESWCVEGACVNYESESYGEGDCAESADHFAYRGYSVTYEDGSSVTGAYVYQYCWTYDDGETQGEGNALSVALTRIDWTTFTMEGVILYWDSGSWGEGSWCGMMVIAHSPGVDLFEPVPCVAGDAPPMILPPMPPLP